MSRRLLQELRSAVEHQPWWMGGVLLLPELLDRPLVTAGGWLLIGLWFVLRLGLALRQGEAETDTGADLDGRAASDQPSDGTGRGDAEGRA